MKLAGTEVVVGGFGVSGYAAVAALTRIGARVTLVDDRDDHPPQRVAALEELGARVRLGAGATAALPPSTDLVVISPGWPPRTPLLVEAAAQAVPVWGEVELGWRLRRPGAPPWLCVTGTNGKTTTVQMLAAILTAAGLRAAAVGNVGRPVTAAVTDPEPLDVLAVELSSFQLHWVTSWSPQAAVLLNVAPDHLDWYDGSLAAYARDKGRVFERAARACIYNAADETTERLARAATVADGCLVVGFTLNAPGAGTLGVSDGVLVDRAFASGSTATELASMADITPSAPHNVANALAAAALARAHGVPATAVRDGLRAFRLDAHRVAPVATLDEVEYVNDSKATNPHAAEASLLSFPSVVWVGGGLAKGAAFDELVRATRDRLRGAVLIGADRHRIAAALARHAPDVPVVEVDGGETGTVMDRVVDAAAAMSRPGDIVLLAPGCASQDMFAEYGARGDAFAAAVQRRVGLAGQEERNRRR